MTKKVKKEKEKKMSTSLKELTYLLDKLTNNANNKEDLNLICVYFDTASKLGNFVISLMIALVPVFITLILQSFYDYYSIVFYVIEFLLISTMLWYKGFSETEVFFTIHFKNTDAIINDLYIFQYTPSCQ